MLIEVCCATAVACCRFGVELLTEVGPKHQTIAFTQPILNHCPFPLTSNLGQSPLFIHFLYHLSFFHIFQQSTVCLSLLYAPLILARCIPQELVRNRFSIPNST